jgi:hypothetical protein
MNVFNVLSQGKSRLHEPSMSAMLGYLLDSNKDHGLGDAFIRTFLEHVDSNLYANILSTEKIHSYVSLEEPYNFLNGAKKDIDIQILLFDKNRKEVLCKIIIENKIRIGSANTQQLRDYYEAIKEFSVQENEPEKSSDCIFNPGK